MWKFNYSNTPFIRYTAGDLYSYIWSAARQAADKRQWHVEQTKQILGNFHVSIRLEPIPRVVFKLLINKFLSIARNST